MNLQNEMKFNCGIEFDKIIGVLEDTQLEGLSIFSIFSPHDGNQLHDYSKLRELMQFCKEHPSYHIATYTSDGDSHEFDTQEEADNSQVFTASNCIRYVNRDYYVLCRGNSDENLYLEEIEKY